jgi:hypothetical protein
LRTKDPEHGAERIFARRFQEPLGRCTLLKVSFVFDRCVIHCHALRHLAFQNKMRSPTLLSTTFAEPLQSVARQMLNSRRIVSRAVPWQPISMAGQGAKMHPRLTVPIGPPSDMDPRGLPVRRSKRSYDRSVCAHSGASSRIVWSSHGQTLRRAETPTVKEFIRRGWEAPGSSHRLPPALTEAMRRTSCHDTPKSPGSRCGRSVPSTLDPDGW